MTRDPRTQQLTAEPGGIRTEQGADIPVKVVIVDGIDVGREMPFEGTLTVGTEASCDLVLADPAVSRRHVSFTTSEGRVRVRDLGSRNGTFVDGTRMVEGDVRVGAVLRVGNSALTIQPRWQVREVNPSSSRSFGALVGESVAMRHLFALLERVAPTDVTVLLEGESGTGKEVATRSIHAASHRRDGPFVVFDCGSVPASLAESELFGHRKGAFTGAVADRRGAFQRAHGGTILLDEIGELPPEIQPKLLRVLESSEVRPVGSDSMVDVDVRVVAATNRDLHAEAQCGRFRSDLLYRLEVVRVRIPPLRERPEDVPLLAAHFLDGVCPREEIAGDNLGRLIGYSWPGNVRELRNTLARAVALAGRPGGEGPRFDDLAFNLGPATEFPRGIGVAFPGVVTRVPYKEAKRQVVGAFERAYIESLLDRHQGNITRAAAEAGLSRKHLYDLIRRTVGQVDDEPG